MQTIIVVGNGMVGYKFCEKFVTKAPEGKFKIIVFGEEPRPAYDRVHLSAFFENQDAKALEMAPKEWYDDNNIELISNERITDIHRASKKITTSNDLHYKYDYLVLATGSAPFVPNIKGIEKKGVFVYRTIEDLEDMLAYADNIQVKNKGTIKTAVLGGGLLGLEAAKAVMDMGFEPHVVEFAPKLMPRQLDTRASKVLQEKIESIGINVHLSKATNKILGDKTITGMEFGEYDKIDVEMLVISAGIRPRDELGKTCNLEMGTRGGIVVNNKMQTSDSEIYAIGEVALYNQMIYGLVAPGYEMADVAADQILGIDTRMSEEIDMSTKLKLIGVDVASYGEPFMPIERGYSIIYENKTKNLYKRINVSHDGKSLLGGILVGDASDYNMFHQIYLNGLPIPEDAEELIIGSRGEGDSSFGSVMDIPDAAQVCSCESVTKGQICGAITEGNCEDLAAVISSTKASTSCGGCKPMVTDLVNETLKSLGKTIKENVCEHFDYSRQELYAIIKAKKTTSFDEALNDFGTGDGCELCKPLVASIFASLYNNTPNKEDVIQDSNDKFLANIQRNGTYSVVPRIAGGEITPEKLIILGEIGKKYNLYTKITGGARIDFFGAELNDLPSIWKELIDAGFESGHAYGKSLRTVKSCVGSTWCRYGLDESVSFAIKLENRYKGLRSPHKIKGGVSGCIRECAEARGKDFGVIAVEGGWNLYVGGNGGATPKHAQLLAEQIDSETVIKYLDRYLIYYIQTAAPLMRTAAWLEKLEGGIDQLKKVVIDDSLNIADDLEKEMEFLVDAYECEWKQVVESKESQKRFSHFINSDDRDDNLVFVPLRDQKMPEHWEN